MSAASLGIDDSIRTGSILRDPEPADPGEDADARTIRHAVTSADLRVLEKGSIAWANRETGSSGNVVEIDEVTTGAGPCRRFVASRQNFEGIFLYRGEACLLADGHWRLKRFEAVGA